jgi:hypothetical protein
MAVTQRSARVAATVVLAVVVGAMAGCSSADDDSSDAAASTTSVRRTTTSISRSATSVPRTVDDRAVAQQAVLTIKDLPSGYRVGAPPEQAIKNPTPAQKAHVNAVRLKLMECFPGDVSLYANPQDAHSATSDFDGPNEEWVFSRVVFAKTKAEVHRVLDVLSGPNAEACWSDSSKKAQETYTNLPSTMKAGPWRTSRLDVKAPEGTRVEAFRTDIHYESDEYGAAETYEDVFVAQKGKVLVSIHVLDSIDPFPTDVSVPLLNKVLARLP